MDSEVLTNRVFEVLDYYILFRGRPLAVRNLLKLADDLDLKEKKPDDIDTDAEDHVADETRYRVLHTSAIPNWRGGRSRLGG